MAYYNWGEQIGNSFMNMYAQNQQKRLEEARMGMEKERLDMDRQKMESQLRTDALQQQYQTLQMDEINKENAFWAGMGTGKIDLNGDNVLDKNESNLSYKYYNDWNNLGFQNRTFSQVDPKTGQISDVTKYIRGSEYDMMNNLFTSRNDSALKLYGEQEATKRSNASNAISAEGNALQRQILQQDRDRMLEEKDQGVLQSQVDYLNKIGYISNGEYSPYWGSRNGVNQTLPSGRQAPNTIEEYNKYISDTARQFGRSEKWVKDNIRGILSYNARMAPENLETGSLPSGYQSGGKTITNTSNTKPSNPNKLTKDQARKAGYVIYAQNGYIIGEKNGKQIPIYDKNNNFLRAE